jgi:hypothetical protein
MISNTMAEIPVVGGAYIVDLDHSCLFLKVCGRCAHVRGSVLAVLAVARGTLHSAGELRRCPAQFAGFVWGFASRRELESGAPALSGILCRLDFIPTYAEPYPKESRAARGVSAAAT